MRKHTCPRTRTEPLARWVAPATAPAARAPRATGGLSRGRCCARRWAGTTVRITGGPRCASAPCVVCALRYGCKSLVAVRLARWGQGVRAVAQQSTAKSILSTCGRAAQDAVAPGHGLPRRCESPEGRIVNRPSMSFSHSGAVVSGSAWASANKLRNAARQSGRSALAMRPTSTDTSSAPNGFRRTTRSKPLVWPLSPCDPTPPWRSHPPRLRRRPLPACPTCSRRVTGREPASRWRGRPLHQLMTSNGREPVRCGRARATTPHLAVQRHQPYVQHLLWRGREARPPKRPSPFGGRPSGCLLERSVHCRQHPRARLTVDPA